MTYHNGKFHCALAQYTKLAFHLLDQHVSPSEPSAMSSQWHKWVPVEGLNGHLYESVQVPMYPEIVRNQLHGSVEFLRCVDALENNPVTTKHLDQFIGIALPDRAHEPSAQLRGSPQMGAKDYCDHIWKRMASGNNIFDEASFEQEYGLLEKDFYGDDIPVRIIAPLIDFWTNNAVAISNDLAIKGLDDCDIGKYLNTQGPRDRLILGRLESPPKWSLIHETQVKKVIGNGPVTRAPYLDRVDEAITALCAFRAGSFRTTGFFVVSDSIFHQGTLCIGGPEVYWPHRDQLNFNDSMAGKFLEFFTSLSSALNGPGKRALGVAPRRMRYAAQRHRAEDRIVDLFIAAEALFLPKQSAEIRYKFAMRAACLLKSTPEERRATFTKMKMAYDIRSALVHGGNPKYPIEGDRKMTADAYALYIENAVFDALHNIIDRINSGDGWGEDKHWDTLIFGFGETANDLA